MVGVIILSLLVVAAFIGVVYGFVRQYRIYSQVHTPAVTAVTDAAVVGGSAASVQLAPGAHIVSATSDAGKLVLHVTTKSGSEVDIFDLATGKLTSQVKESP